MARRLRPRHRARHRDRRHHPRPHASPPIGVLRGVGAADLPCARGSSRPRGRLHVRGQPLAARRLGAARGGTHPAVTRALSAGPRARDGHGQSHRGLGSSRPAASTLRRVARAPGDLRCGGLQLARLPGFRLRRLRLLRERLDPHLARAGVALRGSNGCRAARRGRALGAAAAGEPRESQGRALLHSYRRGGDTRARGSGGGPRARAEHPRPVRQRSISAITPNGIAPGSAPSSWRTFSEAGRRASSTSSARGRPRPP